MACLVAVARLLTPTRPVKLGCPCLIVHLLHGLAIGG